MRQGPPAEGVLPVRMKLFREHPSQPKRVRRPLTLDELHLHARTVVVKLTGSRSFASPTLSVAEIPLSVYGHAVGGQFRLASPDAGAPGARPRGVHGLLYRLHLALGTRYRSCEITIAPSLAEALSPLFAKEGSLRVGLSLVDALATLIHEEFHAVHSIGWPGLVQDRILETPGVRQLTEGIVELGVEKLFGSILPELGLGGLMKAAPLLQKRRAYVAQLEAARALVDHVAEVERVPANSVLTRALQFGSGTIALRTLVHDLACSRDLDDRIPEWKWKVARFQAELPPGAERRITLGIIAPFEELGAWFSSTPEVFGDTAREHGRLTGIRTIERLDDLMVAAA